ncbi:hypothetical protein PBI_OVECHKIN_81 [Mycobacterium phage Ovechkin]|uniref:Uncharacterized protein n=1 Tax=Mycobacterium phage Ovechkin TaxID=1673889 RepID=A0A0H4TFM1_9CAUD|nr:hypothetical protein PBI_OVECHKIN_81 [Mycobacterium phage Ovechkin]AKQ06983.1 hypothetical protein PBI_OVECHKIN_81 [Mycobacterium phage Ovechkin]
MNNPELRAVLTEAQRASILSRAAAALQEAEHQSGGGFLGYRALAEAALDVTLDALASLPGVAVIQLPEPSWTKPEEDDENGAAAWEYPDGEIVVYDDGDYEWRGLGINSDDADRLREGAAALLAAAAAVVAEGEDRG